VLVEWDGCGFGKVLDRPIVLILVVLEWEDQV